MGSHGPAQKGLNHRRMSTSTEGSKEDTNVSVPMEGPEQEQPDESFKERTVNRAKN